MSADELREGWAAYRQFVNPLVALRAELLGEPVKVRSVVEGQLVLDDATVEDFHGTQTFGHRNPVVTQAVTDFLATPQPNWFPARVNPHAGALAKALCERSARTSIGHRPAYDNVFFAHSGSGAVEAAMKMARAATGRPRVLSVDGAYHGTTMGSCSLMKPGMFRDPFGPHLPGCGALPFGDVDALAEAIRANDVAAVIMEPIQLEGGVRTHAPAYIEAACELTARHGTMLVADEIQTGLGRTGRFLASEIWPRRPDGLVLGKHLGGGLMPISAFMTRSELFERAYGGHYASAEAHNSTFSGHALACIAGLAVLELLTDDAIARVARLGTWLRGELQTRLSRHALFDDLRGEGLLVGIGLHASDHPWLSFEHFGVDGLADQPTVGVIVCHRLYKRGFYAFACGHDWRILRILPRFNIPEAVLARFVDVIDDEVGYVSGLA